MKEEWLDGFRISRFSFNLKAEESGYLPKHLGNTLRGGFGITFRSIVCPDRRRDCRTCEQNSRCAYFYIFETPGNGNNDNFSSYSDIPRPFIIELDNNQNNSVIRGDPLRFGLILIGKAIDYLPYFIFCFDNLGKNGIGGRRVKFSLGEVCGFDFQKKLWTRLYDAREHFLKDDIPIISANELLYECKDTLTLNFLTPTRIKYRDSYITNMEFHIMIRNLLRRVAMMMFFHCDTELKVDYTELITSAKNVDVQHWDLKWHDWERYSTRKNTEMRLGGFIGNVTYKGDFERFMPFIALGEQIHIGKSTTFGLGKYTIL
jgi:CRISPR-associated endoribonuclease Cas6